jgi:hypothetical protein
LIDWSMMRPSCFQVNRSEMKLFRVKRSEMKLFRVNRSEMKLFRVNRSEMKLFRINRSEMKRFPSQLLGNDAISESTVKHGSGKNGSAQVHFVDGRYEGF